MRDGDRVALDRARGGHVRLGRRADDQLRHAGLRRHVRRLFESCCTAQRSRLHPDAVRSRLRSRPAPRSPTSSSTRRRAPGTPRTAILRTGRSSSPDDAWSETGVTWNTRPDDGSRRSVTRRSPAGRTSVQSSLSFGAADVWRAGCSVDPDPAGNQTKVFPSTTDGFPRTVADAEAGFIDRVTTERNRRRQAVARALDAQLPLLPGRGEHGVLGPLLHA